MGLVGNGMDDLRLLVVTRRFWVARIFIAGVSRLGWVLLWDQMSLFVFIAERHDWITHTVTRSAVVMTWTVSIVVVVIEMIPELFLLFLFVNLSQSLSVLVGSVMTFGPIFSFSKRRSSYACLLFEHETFLIRWE